MSLYCIQNARGEAQRERMRSLEAAGVCIFCPEGLAAYGDRSPLLETPSWQAFDNDFPYAGARRHVLLIPRRHVPELLDLDDAARSEFWEILALTRSALGTDHYGLGVRSGNCAATGGTVEHLHLHVLVPEPGPLEKPLRMRFSS